MIAIAVFSEATVAQSNSVASVGRVVVQYDFQYMLSSFSSQYACAFLMVSIQILVVHELSEYVS